MSSEPILEVSGLRISFDGPPAFTAVQDLSFSLSKGATLAIVGESGSGKSLTALALMGLLPPQARLSGSMQLRQGDGSIPLTGLDARGWEALRGPKLSMVFQEPMSALNPVMKIGAQLRESILAHQDIPKAEAKALAVSWLQKVQLPQPELLYNRYPHQLSGGQKQRVMIAMAMCNHPRVLLADEPTTALDVTVQQEIISLMQGLQQEHGSAMIFITHDLALAAGIADEVLVMYQGRVMEYGPAARVLHEPQHPYTRALLACRPAAGHKGSRLPVVSDFWRAEGEPEPPRPAAPVPAFTEAAAAPEPLLSVHDLQIWFAGKTGLLGGAKDYYKAVQGVSFDLMEGEVLGLVGESGCGKSTLSRSLMGLVPVRSGQLLFEGKDLAALPPAGWKQVRRQIQMVFQDPYASLNPRLSIGQVLTEPMQAHGIRPAGGYKAEVLRLLDLVGLPAATYSRYPHQFSGGQRQRIGIARALSLQPRLLICDESVSALDVSIQAQILNLLRDLRQQFGLTYLFISHDLNVVHYISDRVLVMQQGRLVEQGPAGQVLQHPQHPYTRRLVAAVPQLD